MKADSSRGALGERPSRSATPFREWCQHYGYCPRSDQARTDYWHYLQAQAVLVEVFTRDPARATRPD